VRGGLHLDEASGERWELALQLLADEVEVVAFTNVVLRSRKGELTISIETAHDPKLVTAEQARTEIDAGQQLVGRLREVDRRFDDLMRQRHVIWEYVYDYDTGSVLLADLAEDGRASWAKGWEPSA
jgi:hypothetical protein